MATATQAPDIRHPKAISNSQQIDWSKASLWAMEAVSRNDLKQVVARMSDQQLITFEGLVANMEIDTALSYFCVPESEHAALTLSIEAKRAQISSAHASIRDEQRRRECQS